MRKHVRQKLAEAEKHLRSARSLVQKLSPETTKVRVEVRERAEELSYAYHAYEREANQAVARLSKLTRDAELLRANTDQSIRTIQQLAYRDPKTGLANAHLLREFLHSLASARPRDCDILVALVDLDCFGVINEVLGLDRGDRVLVEVAERLQTLIGPSDAVGRTREDEFMIICSNVDSLSVLERFRTLVGNIKRVLSEPFKVDEQSFRVTASIGGCCLPTFAGSTEELVHHADAALSHVKMQGRDQGHFYSAQLQTYLQRHAVLELQMPRALKTERFYLRYQPILRLNPKDSGVDLVAVETQVCWNHSVEGILLAEDFLPVAERSGFVVELGYWILTKVCEQILSWKRQGLEPIVFVSLAGRQLLEADMACKTQDLVRSNQVEPFRLVFEFRDNFATLNEEQVEDATLALCRAGFSLALKDFGDCVYSLNRLARVRYLKLSSRLLKEDRPLCGQALEMAESLDALAIGTNIEQPEELDFLRTLGCEFGQGELLSKALSGDQVAELAAPDLGSQASFY